MRRTRYTNTIIAPLQVAKNKFCSFFLMQNNSLRLAYKIFSRLILKHNFLILYFSDLYGSDKKKLH